jgi:hypothetical protein
MKNYPDPGADHSGVFLLNLVRVENIPNLQGRYFTDRITSKGTRGTQGHIAVALTKHPLSNTLNFKPSKWAMRKPIDIPSSPGG